MTSGYWCTRGVVGSYWISSQMSVRATTAPGVTARSRPTSNASGDTIAGIRGAVERSDASARAPRTALSPPVSMSAFQATGLTSGLLLGAAASTRFRTMNPARSASRQPSSASASSDSAAAAPARYSCTIRLRKGFCVHAGSVNRRSRGAGARAERPAVIRPSSVPSAAARRATDRGWRARCRPSRSTDPSGWNRCSTPRAASDSSRSSAGTPSAASAKASEEPGESPGSRRSPSAGLTTAPARPRRPGRPAAGPAVPSARPVAPAPSWPGVSSPAPLP